MAESKISELNESYFETFLSLKKNSKLNDIEYSKSINAIHYLEKFSISIIKAKNCKLSYIIKSFLKYIDTSNKTLKRKFSILKQKSPNIFCYKDEYTNYNFSQKLFEIL